MFTAVIIYIIFGILSLAAIYIFIRMFQCFQPGDQDAHSVNVVIILWKLLSYNALQLDNKDASIFMC